MKRYKVLCYEGPEDTLKAVLDRSLEGSVALGPTRITGIEVAEFQLENNTLQLLENAKLAAPKWPAILDPQARRV